MTTDPHPAGTAPAEPVPTPAPNTASISGQGEAVDRPSSRMNAAANV